MRSIGIKYLSSREKARRVRDFIHYVDTSGDFWAINEGFKNSRQRLEFAGVLRNIRKGCPNSLIYYLEFFMENYAEPYLSTRDMYSFEAVELGIELFGT